MIPQDYVSELKRRAPWPQNYQAEQDLIISSALVEAFSHPLAADSLAFRGGTALFKLYMTPFRYSEDIDLVQVTAGPIGPIMGAIQEHLNPWLGAPKRDRSEGRVTLTYRIQSEEGLPLKLKVEINSREHFSVYDLHQVEFRGGSRWFSGAASILTYHLDELLATKVRALYQRKKGRDLFDLWKAFDITYAQPDKVIGCFLKCMEHEGRRVSRAEFEESITLKLEDPRFLDDIAPPLAPDCLCDVDDAADCVLKRLAVFIPGDRWQAKRKRLERPLDDECADSYRASAHLRGRKAPHRLLV
jgi:predicted nucleotidyltransferase component of viral defense system